MTAITYRTDIENIILYISPLYDIILMYYGIVAARYKNSGGFMATVIMVASGKGGTGKSTFAAFFAAELALSGKKTLLIELDAGLRSIDVISGTGNQAVYDIGDILAGRCSVDKAVTISPHSEKLHIISAPYSAGSDDFSGLRRMVNSVYGDYDYIVMDTAAGLGNAFYEAAKVAVMGIIVITADVVSVRDGRLVGDEMYAEGVSDIRLIINKFSEETFKYSGFEDLDRIIDAVCARLLGVIPYSGRIAACSMNGTVLGESVEKQIFSAIAQRTMGKDIQIIIK